ncbi:MAG: potassium channel protein [Actinomycetota bacterium]|nr:potassium channel protein [Actinomycetota bacterium]MDQ3681044.1 potassium channel protein [Actinomycetota bacterium]
MTVLYRRVVLGLLVLAAVMVAGTAGYVMLGFGVLDAVYQTVTTITTVGFREVHPLSTNGKVFTIVLILTGVGTALYTFTVALETLIDGHLRDLFGRRRMERQMAKMTDHVIVCGWGRVGQSIASYLANAGQELVVVDRDPERIPEIPHSYVLGDITEDDVMKAAGIERARVLVAALDTDAANLYATLSGRSLRPDLFIIARAHTDSSQSKLERAGANRVVNPQRIGGARMAALAMQPHVAEFLDVVMHDGDLEFRLEEIEVPQQSPLAGRSLRESHIRDRTGALVLALRGEDGSFTTNPPPETEIGPGHILIAIGTAEQLCALEKVAHP